MALPEIIKDIDARVIRPASTDNAIVRFDGTTGQIQNTANTIDDNNNTIINGRITSYVNDPIGNFLIRNDAQKSSERFIDNYGNLIINLCDRDQGTTYPFSQLVIGHYNNGSPLLHFGWGKNGSYESVFNILHSGNVSSYAWTGKSNMTWDPAVNILCTGTGAEWSIDCNETSPSTGDSFFHIWSSNLGNSMIQCFPKDGRVVVPYKLAVSGSFIGDEKLSVNGHILISNGTIQFNYNGAGLIYADSTETTYGGLVLCGSREGWLGGAGLVVRACDANNDSPGSFFLKAQKNKGAQTSGSDLFLLIGNGSSGELNWNGSCFAVYGSGRMGPTGHTISTSGSIGAGEEVYATNGFFAGGTSNINMWYNNAWWHILGNHANGNIGVNAAGAGLYLGLDNTQFVAIRPTSSTYNFDKLCVDQYHTYVSSSGSSVEPNNATLELREAGYNGTSWDHIPRHAPRLGFHYAGRYWAQIAYFDSAFRFYNASLSGYEPIYGSAVYGAVWNDYAEYRESNITQPGRCIIENGDDTLKLSTERLQRGAEIVSDTFGFAIGETDTCKTPIAASGRVLAYGYEDREQFKSHIGYPVCSGPNGTVSIMTDEEEQLYPSRIIGYISAVPDYEIWGTGNVKVDGRIWIRIK